MSYQSTNEQKSLLANDNSSRSQNDYDRRIASTVEEAVQYVQSTFPDFANSINSTEQKCTEKLPLSPAEIMVRFYRWTQSTVSNRSLRQPLTPLTIDQTHRYVSADISDFLNANKNPIDGYEKLTISTLDEALRRILPNYPRWKKQVENAKENCIKNSSVLTNEESAAIYLYTMGTSFYEELNSALRAKNRHELKPWFGFLKLFLTALKKLPKKRVPLWRGICINNTSDYNEINLSIWWSVNSCTTDLATARFFMNEKGILFLIDPINAVDMSEYSAYPAEQEFILMPGTRLKVKWRPTDQQENPYIIHLQEENSETMPETPSASESNSKPTSSEMKVKVYEDGSRYEGQFYNGKRHGFGTCTYINKGEYVGQWIDDQASGIGIRSLSNGNRYEGAYKNGKRNGKGIFSFADGTIYDGEWADDKYNGSGLVLWPNKARFIGKFKDNARDGEGIQELNDGSIIRGSWQNGELQCS